MKAICCGGIQDNVRPEEINKKIEHDDKASKNSYITVSSDLVRPWHMKWKASYILLSDTPIQWKMMICALTFFKSERIIHVIDVKSDGDILIFFYTRSVSVCVHSWFHLGCVSRAALTDVVLWTMEQLSYTISRSNCLLKWFLFFETDVEPE